MQEYLPHLCAAGGLLLGFLPAFLFLKSKLAGKDSQLARAEADFENSQHNLAERDERIGKHQQEAGKLREELQETGSHLAQARTENKNLQEKLDQQAQAQKEQDKILRERFENLANDILDAKTKKFTDTNKENLKGILEPLDKDLKEFRKKVEDYHGKDNVARATLLERLKSMQADQARLSEDAQNLTDALKGNSKQQGDWGEIMLARTLEVAGLEEGRDFSLQETFDRQRPDAVIKLPDQRQIIVDAKVSLTAYERYCTLEEEQERSTALKDHVASLRHHVDQLAEKDYPAIEGLTTPDFVLLFVPVEPAFGAALRTDPGLYEYAFRKRVVLVTSTTLMATLRTVENVWRIEKQNLNAEEIAKKAGDLYDKFVGFIGNLESVGKALGKADEAYHDAVKKLHTGHGNLLNRTEALRKLGIKAKKELPASYQEKLENSAEDSSEPEETRPQPEQEDPPVAAESP